MMKIKRTAKRISVSLAVLLMFNNMASFSVFADETNEEGWQADTSTTDTTEVEYGQEVTLDAQGQNTQTETTDTTVTNTEDTNTTTQTTQKKTNKTTVHPDVQKTSSLKAGLQNTANADNLYREWLAKIKSTPNYTDGKWYGSNSSSASAKNLSYISVPNTDIANLLNQNTDYRDSLTTNSAGVDTANTLPSDSIPSTANNSDYGKMSTSEKNATKTAIVLNEKGESTSKENIGSKQSTTLRKSDEKVGNGDFTIGQNDDGSLNINMNNDKDNSNLTNNGNYTNPRTDAVGGGNTKLTINNDNSYWKRLKALYERAGNEDWEYYYKNGNTKYYKTSNFDKSNALNDETYIALLTEYTIESVQKDVVTKTNYTSDVRRWTVYLEGVQVCDPVETDNPLHELDFTEIYKEYGAGNYYVVAEQEATFTKATYVTYDKCEYLFEMSTGSILWFKESKVSNGDGVGVYVGTETVDTPEWVETGDTYTIRVNENGEIDTDSDTGSKRTD